MHAHACPETCTRRTELAMAHTHTYSRWEPHTHTSVNGVCRLGQRWSVAHGLACCHNFSFTTVKCGVQHALIVSMSVWATTCVSLLCVAATHTHRRTKEEDYEGEDSDPSSYLTHPLVRHDPKGKPRRRQQRGDTKTFQIWDGGRATANQFLCWN